MNKTPRELYDSLSKEFIRKGISSIRFSELEQLYSLAEKVNVSFDLKEISDINAIGDNARVMGEERWNVLEDIIPDHMEALDKDSFLQGFEEASQNHMAKITASTREFKNTVISMESLLFDLLPVKNGKPPLVTPTYIYNNIKEMRDNLDKAVRKDIMRGIKNERSNKIK